MIFFFFQPPPRHLNNSINEAASPPYRRRADWQSHNGCNSWDSMSSGGGDERSVGAGSGEVEKGERIGARSVIPFHCPPTPPPVPCIIFFFLLRQRLSWQYWTQFPWREAEPFHRFSHWWRHSGKGTILTSYLTWQNNQLWLIYGLMRVLFGRWPKLATRSFHDMEVMRAHVLCINNTLILDCFTNSKNAVKQDLNQCFALALHDPPPPE